jgi:putative hemolysin
MSGLPAARVGAAALATCSAAMLLVVGCGSDEGDDTPPPGIANPASEFCVEQGGEVEIVTEDDGEVGYCALPDGTRVDEWEYFRANAPSTTATGATEP